MYKNYFSKGFFLFLTALLNQFSNLLGKDFFITSTSKWEEKRIPIYIGIHSNQDEAKDRLAFQKDVGRRWERDTG